MHERQRELIDRVRLSSKIAASPAGIRPEAPRLDPLGSPKEPVTPLALESGAGYFLGGTVNGRTLAASGLTNDEAVRPARRGDQADEILSE